MIGPRARVVVVVVAAIAFTTGCSDDSGDAPPTGPDRTEDERLAIDALASIGLPAQPAEHAGPRGASLRAEAGGIVVHLTSRLAGIEPDGVTVLDEREVGGVPVATVEYASAPGQRTRFDCGDLTYELSGQPGLDLPVPPGFADHDDLVARLLLALGC